jgi:hypothetical protein
MTTTILWVVLAAIVVVAIGVAIAFAVGRSRAAARAAQRDARVVYPVDPECARLGHAYAVEGTGWRCSRCGNHASRIEGEIYGHPEQGGVDRRRKPR